MNYDRFKFRVFYKPVNSYVEVFYDAVLEYTGMLAECDHSEKIGTMEYEFYTVEQCTGTKDKNGKLIFEGDIVMQKYVYYTNSGKQEELLYYKVVWSGVGFKLQNIDDPNDIATCFCGAHYEIVGDIHGWVKN